MEGLVSSLALQVLFQLQGPENMSDANSCLMLNFFSAMRSLVAVCLFLLSLVEPMKNRLVQANAGVSSRWHVWTVKDTEYGWQQHAPWNKDPNQQCKWTLPQQQCSHKMPHWTQSLTPNKNHTCCLKAIEKKTQAAPHQVHTCLLHPT